MKIRKNMIVIAQHKTIKDSWYIGRVFTINKKEKYIAIRSSNQNIDNISVENYDIQEFQGKLEPIEL